MAIVKIGPTGAWPVLRAEEIPQEHRDSFIYPNQEFMLSGNRQVLKIERKCSVCPNTYWVVVSNIRGDLRRGRAMRNGKCKDCRGRVTSSQGYIWVHQPEHPNAYSGRYVPEHVLVMEEFMGRLLDPSTESVHHVDGDRTNNNIKNLQLRNRFHGRGQAWECNSCGSHDVSAVALRD